jgi:hypothetical protein
MQKVVQPAKLGILVHDTGKNPTSQRVLGGDVLAARSANVDRIKHWVQDQVSYLKNLALDDLMTAMAYTVRSMTWIGTKLLHGYVPTEFYKDVVFALQPDHVAPLYPQMRKLVDTYGYQVYTANQREPTAAKYMAVFADKTEAPGARYNAYRNLLKSGMFSKRAVYKAVEQYEVDLKRIVNDAPRLEAPIHVYRGNRIDIFTTKNEKNKRKPIEAKEITSKLFVSTTLFPDYARMYSKGGHYMRIRVMPSTGVLLLAALNRWEDSGEYEVLLNIGTKFTVLKRDVKRWMLTKDNNYKKFNDVKLMDHVHDVVATGR